MKQLLLLIFICLTQFAEAQIKEFNLTNTALEPSDNFGTSVSVSNEFVAVGAIGLNDNAGGVFVYKGFGQNWTLHSTLIPEESKPRDFLGMDVAMNEKYMVIGAPTDHWVDEETGRAFIYELIDEEWVQSATIQPSGSYLQSAFGFIVNIHNEVIMIGAPDHDYSEGALQVYEKSDDEWKKSHEFINNDFQISSFGCAFDMNDDWLAIGGYETNYDSIELGTKFIVQMYEKQGMNWQERQKIEFEPQSIPYQIPAYSVELSDDQLLIGNHRASSDVNIDGETKVFHFINEQWEAVQSFHPDGFEIDEIGRQVALGDRYAMIGCSKKPSWSLPEPHHILIYNTENKDNWTLIADFQYDGSSLLNWQGFNIDINNFYGVAATHHHAEEHGDVYIYDLRRFVDNENVLDDTEINIYPIPSRDKLTIENEGEAITAYKIFSTTGQVVMQSEDLNQKRIQLNISELIAGNYWIKVMTEQGHLYRQISKM